MNGCVAVEKDRFKELRTRMVRENRCVVVKLVSPDGFRWVAESEWTLTIPPYGQRMVRAEEQDGIAA